MDPAIAKLIIRRLRRQFRTVLLLVLGPIVLFLFASFLLLFVVSVECWVFGKAIYANRILPSAVCTYDGRFHWHKLWPPRY